MNKHQRAFYIDAARLADEYDVAVLYIGRTGRNHMRWQLRHRISGATCRYVTATTPSDHRSRLNALATIRRLSIQLDGQASRQLVLDL